MFSVGIPAICGGDERWFDADKKIRNQPGWFRILCIGRREQWILAHGIPAW